jgi:hypothetical protein
LTAGTPDQDEMVVSKMYNMAAPPAAPYNSSEIHLFGLVTQTFSNHHKPLKIKFKI